MSKFMICWAEIKTGDRIASSISMVVIVISATTNSRLSKASTDDRGNGSLLGIGYAYAIRTTKTSAISAISMKRP